MSLGPQIHLLEPAPRKAGIYTPRPYQLRADERIDQRLSTERAALAVQATGVGKTVLFCMQAQKRGGALVLAHRDTLIRQAHEKLEAATGDYVAIEKAELRAFPCPYVVASVQTLKGARLDNFVRRFPDIQFIVIDEAHRAVAKSYRTVIDRWPNAKILGVTATPDRSDEVGLRAVFGDGVADEYNIIDATADGWLTPIRFLPIKSEVNIDAVRLVGSGSDRDFDQSQLDDAVTCEAGRVAGTFVQALTKYGHAGERGIGFCAGVKSAHAISDAVNQLMPGHSAVLDGTMPDAEKRPILDDHRAGRIKVIWNVGVLTEGHDDPGLTFVFDAAATKSRLRAMQKWGRVTRTGIDVDRFDTAAERRDAIATSWKPWAVVYDLVMNSSRHDVICGLDVLTDGKEINDKVRKAAVEIIKQEGGTVEEAIEKAKVKLERSAAAAIAAKHVAASVKLVPAEPPRSVFDRAGVKWLNKKCGLPKRPEDYPSEAQKWKLKNRGIPMPEKCSRQVATRLINLDMKRETEGKCRLGGVEYLRKFGIDAWKLTSEEGRALRDAIYLAGHVPLTEQEVGRIILDVRARNR